MKMIKSRFILFFILVLAISLLLMSTNVLGDETPPVKPNLTFVSTLPTPPLGYKIVKSLGAVFVYEQNVCKIKNQGNSEIKENVDLSLAQAETNFAVSAAAKGANAILNKRTDLKISSSTSMVTGTPYIFSVTIEGEAVVLERTK
jgi:uncharacterized protein YbjQ (UPF0145 family)